MQLLTRELIKIPPDRQRGTPDVDAVAALAKSIQENGLMHPIVVTPTTAGSYDLIAGHTRLLAMDFIHEIEGETFLCGDTTIPPAQIPVLLFSDLSPTIRFTLELEENIRRTELPWQKQVEAYARLHALKTALGLHHGAALVATEAHITAVSGAAPRSVGEVHQDVLLGQHLSDPAIAGASNKKEALKLVAKKLRKEADTAAASTAVVSVNLINTNCLLWLANQADASFDGVVSDPPYGIDIRQMSWQASSDQAYDDSYENWVLLVIELIKQLSRVLKPNSEGYLFCNWTRFSELEMLLQEAGFETYSRPLIWSRGQDGRVTSAEKWPKHVYECIMYFRRGDRQLRSVQPDVILCPADRDIDNYHGAKKPIPLLVDLISRSFGPGDVVIDPFAGSGSTLLAAHQCNVSCVGIELSPEYYALALRRLSAPQPTQEEFL